MSRRRTPLAALIGRLWRQPGDTPTRAVESTRPAADVADAAAWAALTGPSQPIPPLGVLPPPATPDRAATLRLLRTLRRACGLEERG